MEHSTSRIEELCHLFSQRVVSHFNTQSISEKYVWSPEVLWKKIHAQSRKIMIRKSPIVLGVWIIALDRKVSDIVIVTHPAKFQRFFSPPVVMHGGLLCITLRLSLPCNYWCQRMENEAAAVALVKVTS